MASRSPLRHAKGMTPPPKGEARLGSPFGRAVAARRLRGQLASASAQPMGGSRWQLALSVLANASPPPPKGEARLGSPFGGRYVPVGRCPAADRGGSRDAGTAAAVTERATYQRYHTAHVQGPRSPQKTKDTPFLWRCPFLLGGGAARPPKIKFGGALTTAAEGRMLYT